MSFTLGSVGKVESRGVLWPSSAFAACIGAMSTASGLLSDSLSASVVIRLANLTASFLAVATSSPLVYAPDRTDDAALLLGQRFGFAFICRSGQLVVVKVREVADRQQLACQANLDVAQRHHQPIRMDPERWSLPDRVGQSMIWPLCDTTSAAEGF